MLNLFDPKELEKETLRRMANFPTGLLPPTLLEEEEPEGTEEEED